jgi:hypothetical protein
MHFHCELAPVWLWRYIAQYFFPAAWVRLKDQHR